LDPITDIFSTMHVSAFGLHRLEATAPWGAIRENLTEENITPSNKKTLSTDLAHFAMITRGNCWLSVQGNSEPIPLTGGDRFLLSPRNFDCHARQPANTRKMEFPRDRGEGL
jgi:hypothetical protein